MAGGARRDATAARIWSMLTVQVVEGGVDDVGGGGTDGKRGGAVCARPQYLLYVLNINQTEIAITKMAAVVKVEEGR